MRCIIGWPEAITTVESTGDFKFNALNEVKGYVLRERVKTP